MKIMRLNSYTDAAKSLDNQAWILMWMAISNHETGEDRESALRVNRVFKKVRSICIELNGGQEVRLDPDGGELVLHETEVEMIRTALRNLRRRRRMDGSSLVTAAQTDELLYLEDLLDKAETVTDEQVAELAKKD